MPGSPWASGPGEILQHGLSLLKKDSDVNRRLAMISIDNAVELMMKTFLGLPYRVNGIKIGRDKFREISESFPKLLDALEEHAAAKIDGINLGEVEWYHRLRNELYHQGNGLTVERDKVEVYSELARLLFKNLFGVDLDVKEAEGAELLGHFMTAWAQLERLVSDYAAHVSPPRMRPGLVTPGQAFRVLEADGIISPQTTAELLRINKIRNEVVHGIRDYKTQLTAALVKRVESVTKEIEKRTKED